MRLTLRALVVAATLGCTGRPTGPGERIFAPDSARTGLSGAHGARGAAWVTLTVQARVTERLDIEVVFPAAADGTLDASGAPYPSVVFLQGETASIDRYRWLAGHLATRGYAVVMPDHTFNQTVLAEDNAKLALDAVRDVAGESGTLQNVVRADAPAVVMGHSLGGVTAARQWIRYPDFSAVALLAAYPADDDDLSSRTGSPALLVAGSSDVATGPTRIFASRPRFGSPPPLYALVEGLNHYGWTDAPDSDELTSDGPRPMDLAATRRAALAVVDAWLDTVLRRDAAAQMRLTRGDFPGVTLRP